MSKLMTRLGTLADNVTERASQVVVRVAADPQVTQSATAAREAAVVTGRQLVATASAAKTWLSYTGATSLAALQAVRGRQASNQ